MASSCAAVYAYPIIDLHARAGIGGCGVCVEDVTTSLLEVMWWCIVLRATLRERYPEKCVHAVFTLYESHSWKCYVHDDSEVFEKLFVVCACQPYAPTVDNKHRHHHAQR